MQAVEPDTTGPALGHGCSPHPSVQSEGKAKDRCVFRQAVVNGYPARPVVHRAKHIARRPGVELPARLAGEGKDGIGRQVEVAQKSPDWGSSQTIIDSRGFNS